MTDFSQLKGMTFIAIEGGWDDDYLRFINSQGEVYELKHTQDCCESVYIEDICGNINDLLNSEILTAEEVYSDSGDAERLDGYESYTYSYYKLATVKGYVDIRFFGSSNGYYSESASLYKIEMEPNSVLSKIQKKLIIDDLKDIELNENKNNPLKL